MNAEEQRQFDELKRQNTDMRRQLERLAIHNDVTNATKMQQGYDAHMERLQKESDEIKAVIAMWRDMAHRRHLQEHQEVNQLFKEARAGIEDHSTPYLAELLLGVVIILTHDAEKAIMENPTNFLSDTVSHDLYWLMQFTRLESLWRWANATIVTAWGLGDDTRVVAYEIMRECQRDGQPHIKTLKRLTQAWIDANLKEPPANHETLQDGLRTAQTVRNGKIPNPLPSDRHRQKCVRWYSAIEAHARDKPALLENVESRTVGT